MDRSRLLVLLSECTGDDIWSIDYCREKHLPEAWIRELCDSYESGCEDDSQTIYFRGRMVNQFEGLRDVDIACKIGESFQIPVAELASRAWSRRDLVIKIREAIEDK